MFLASNCFSCTSYKDDIKANLNFEQARTKWHLYICCRKKRNMKHNKESKTLLLWGKTQAK